MGDERCKRPKASLMSRGGFLLAGVEGWGFKSTRAEHQMQCGTYQSENDADDEAAAESLAGDSDRLLFDSARIESIDAWGPAQPWMSAQRCRDRPMLQWRSESESTRTPREGGDKELKRSTMAAKQVEEGRFLASGGTFRLGWTIR